MKTERGKQSPEQAEFEKAVIEQGYGYCVPKGAKAAIDCIISYLENGTY